MPEHLRPVERRILAMRDAGHDVVAIAEKIGRSPAHVERMIGWTSIARVRPIPHRFPRALESRVLALRNAGETHEEIGGRFKRSPEFIRRVEGLAHFKIALELLTRSEIGSPNNAEDTARPLGERQ